MRHTTIGLATVRGRQDVLVIKLPTDAYTFMSADVLHGTRLHNTTDVKDFRQLLVLDPESEDDMDELAQAVISVRLPGAEAESRHRLQLAQAIQAVLTPLAEEPSDPAVRLRSAYGYVWARVGKSWVSSVGQALSWQQLLQQVPLQIDVAGRADWKPFTDSTGRSVQGI